MIGVSDKLIALLIVAGYCKLTLLGYFLTTPQARWSCHVTALRFYPHGIAVGTDGKVVVLHD